MREAVDREPAGIGGFRVRRHFPGQPLRERSRAVNDEFAVGVNLRTIHPDAAFELVHHTCADRVDGPELIFRPCHDGAAGRAGEQSFGGAEDGIAFLWLK